MEFQSLEEALNFIRMAIEQSMPECAVEIKKIMDEVMDSQIRGWSGQMFYSVVPHSEGMEASAGFEDNGYWESWNGYSVGNPIKFTEAGTTIGREPSTIMETSEGRVENEVIEKLIQILRGYGIDIR